MGVDPWQVIGQAAEEASFPSTEELEHDIGTPYAWCPVCKSRQEIDFSLDGSRTPYCCECGAYEGLGDIEWDDPMEVAEPLTQQERRLLDVIMDTFVSAMKDSDAPQETKDATQTLIDSIYSKLILRRDG
jgi:hypothetical protein